MRLLKSAFDCNKSRSFSAARSQSFQTIGAADQMAVLLDPPAYNPFPVGRKQVL